MKTQHFDTLIIGAGLSGIGTACHLMQQCPDLDFALLERRQNMGGTWDLFRYPGVRSDSDMLSFGYSFRPWNGFKVLADGDSIREYICETANAFGVSSRIRYGVDLKAANWDSAAQLWHLSGVVSTADSKAENGSVDAQTPVSYTCRVLISCTGYYDYREGYQPQFPGVEKFSGPLIHPQQWPENLDYRDKRVVVIGSGATAVTLVPAMAEQARHVTMLQRSPTYIFSVAARDKMAAWLSRFLPQRWVFSFARRRNIKMHRWSFKVSRRWPEFMRGLLLRGVQKQLSGSADLSHFTPTYSPWDQRLCAVPDGDLFKAIKKGKASVVTDEIETFTENGIRLKSGGTLEADILVTATGLKLQLLGGIALTVDGEPVDMRNRLTYKGVLMEGVPNMAWVFGYTNASWTLKADLSGDYISRLLNHMRVYKQAVFVPVDREGCGSQESVMAALQSGYVARADHLLPRQGTQYPWKLMNDYEQDRKVLGESPIDDGILSFTSAHKSIDEERVPEAVV